MSTQDALEQDHRGLLSEATLSALQLNQQPFTSPVQDGVASQVDDALVPFSDDITEEQLADIKQALITGDDLLLVLGENGSGKTTLLKQLSANSGLRIQCFSVTGSERFSTLNLFAGMLEAFKRSPPEKLKDILDELIPCLQSMVGRNTLSVIVLDDAHDVSKTELTQLLSGMLYMNSKDETLLRVALAATSDFEEQIPDLLPEGADLPYSSLTIEGFSPQRAAAYLNYRLQAVGFDQELPFTDRDMSSLVDHSAGRPAELHALTADVLNEKHGRMEYTLPRELIGDEGPGFLQSRNGKLLLGGVATVLILGGILMFLPQGETPVRSVPNRTITQISPTQTTTISAPETVTEEIDTVALADLPTPPDSRTTNTEALDQSQSTPDYVSVDTADTNETSVEVAAATTALATQDSTTTQNTSADQGNSTDTDTSPDIETAPADQSAQTDTNSSEATAAEPTSPELTSTTTLSPEATQPDSDIVTEDTPSEAADEAESQTSDTTPSDNVQTMPTEPTSVYDTLPGLAGLLESPSWILVQDETEYTIQMSASRELKSVQNFLLRHPLPPPNSIFSFERDDVVWYALVHGIFTKLSDAQDAVEKMPEAAQRDQPWIRSIGRIKAILREQ